MIRRPPRSTLFPLHDALPILNTGAVDHIGERTELPFEVRVEIPLDINTLQDRKSTRLNSSHLVISYAVFCLKKKQLKCQSITTHDTRGFTNSMSIVNICVAVT